jgi:hypothetical protein
MAQGADVVVHTANLIAAQKTKNFAEKFVGNLWK